MKFSLEAKRGTCLKTGTFHFVSRSKQPGGSSAGEVNTEEDKDQAENAPGPWPG